MRGLVAIAAAVCLILAHQMWLRATVAEAKLDERRKVEASNERTSINLLRWATEEHNQKKRAEANVLKAASGQLPRPIGD